MNDRYELLNVNVVGKFGKERIPSGLGKVVLLRTDNSGCFDFPFRGLVDSVETYDWEQKKIETIGLREFLERSPTHFRRN